MAGTWSSGRNHDKQGKCVKYISPNLIVDVNEETVRNVQIIIIISVTIVRIEYNMAVVWVVSS